MTLPLFLATCIRNPYFAFLKTDFFKIGALKLPIRETTKAFLRLMPFLAVLLLAFAMTSPVWYDDSDHWGVSKHLAKTGEMAYLLDSESGKADPFSQFITCGPVFHYPGSWVMKIFGTDMKIARMISVAWALCFAFIFYLLANFLTNLKKANWAILIVFLNIQFLTYGSQYIAEIPMVLFLLSGFLMIARSLKEDNSNDWFAWISGGFFFGLAMLVKEYALVPVFPSLAILALFLWIKKENGFGPIVAGMVAGIVLLGGYFFRFGSIENIQAFLEARKVYSTEFFSFGWEYSLPFILLKPLIPLGTIAIFLKIRVRKNRADSWAGIFQLSLIAFYFLSAGFDRFGMLLIFIPAIYLSEFIVLIWEKWVTSRTENGKKIFRFSVFAIGFLALFSQQTFPVLVWRMLHVERVNEAEKCIANSLVDFPSIKIFTCEEQIISFLPERVFYRLPKTVPWAKKENENVFPRQDEWFLEGPYSRTEYFVKLNLSEGKWEKVLECGSGDNQLRLWRPVSEMDYVASMN